MATLQLADNKEAQQKWRDESLQLRLRAGEAEMQSGLRVSFHLLGNTSCVHAAQERELRLKISRDCAALVHENAQLGVQACAWHELNTCTHLMMARWLSCSSCCRRSGLSRTERQPEARHMQPSSPSCAPRNTTTPRTCSVCQTVRDILGTSHGPHSGTELAQAQAQWERASQQAVGAALKLASAEAALSEANDAIKELAEQYKVPMTL